MSEYWKSTPKYYCKHCQLYVRDTKLERQNHEATGKHQGAIKRFLRDLHRGHEREDREKQKAKDEVARLNGVAGSGGGPTVDGPDQKAKTSYGGQNVKMGLSPADRAKQIKQLAEMGVVVPEEYRREMAMTGEWETVSRRVIHSEGQGTGIVKQEDGDSKQDIKIEDGAPLNIGVKRRREDREDEADDGGGTMGRRGWGSSTKEWDGNEELDLEAMMGSKTKEELNSTAQVSCPGHLLDRTADESAETGQLEPPPLKKEESASTLPSLDAVPGYDGAPSVKQDPDGLGTGIVFKKRKARPAR